MLLRLTARQWARYHAGLAGEVTQRLAARRERLILDHMVNVERIARSVAWMFAAHLDIRDLVQAGHVGLIKAADSYRSEDGPFDRFLYLFVRGSVIDAHKRQAYREERNESLDAIQERLGFMPARYDRDRGPLPDELAMESERRERLGAALSAIPNEEQREVLSRALAGERSPGIARSHGRSPNWARVRLNAARDRVAASVRESAA
jgi:RNA polymerase sigma factor (sigma-70 family)